jgi:hypothetical protein
VTYELNEIGQYPYCNRGRVTRFKMYHIAWAVEKEILPLGEMRVVGNVRRGQDPLRTPKKMAPKMRWNLNAGPKSCVSK